MLEKTSLIGQNITKANLCVVCTPHTLMDGKDGPKGNLFKAEDDDLNYDQDALNRTWGS